MKQNKFLALMMAFVMLATVLTGCGGNNDADTGKNDASNQPSSTPTQTGDTPNVDTFISRLGIPSLARPTKEW